MIPANNDRLTFLTIMCITSLSMYFILKYLENV